MKTISIHQWLRTSGKEVCSEARTWLQSLPKGSTMEDAWNQCPRVDWMFWAGLRSPTPENDPRWRQAAFAIVRRTPTAKGTVWDEMPDPAKRCVEVAERFERGEATQEERSAARSAAASAARSAAWSAQAQILREFIPNPWAIITEPTEGSEK